MLAIVAENPIAFHAQNVNGLKSGYVLQLPDKPMTCLIGFASALQNTEWQEGLATSDSGTRCPTLTSSEELTLTEPDRRLIRCRCLANPEVRVDHADVGVEPTQIRRIATLVSTISELEARRKLRADLPDGCRSG